MFEYETPKVVKVKNVPLGIMRFVTQMLIVMFIFAYELWYARGYQEFIEIRSSLTTKVKGLSM